MIRDNIKQKIIFSIIILIVATAIAFAIFTVLKYQVEGEKSVPFELKKIIVISSADFYDDEENMQDEYVWNKNVVQTNDVCIVIGKNDKCKENQIIKNVKIENIQFIETVKLGKIQVYMPNSLEDGLYKYTNDYLVNSSLTYTGAVADNKKALQISNQGGCIYINFANMGLDVYRSNDDQEIKKGAYILEKMNYKNEDLKFKVSFDLIIEVQDKAYKTNVVLDLPIDNVVGQRETHTEITDFSNNIFKRF